MQAISAFDSFCRLLVTSKPPFFHTEMNQSVSLDSATGWLISVTDEIRLVLFHVESSPSRLLQTCTIIWLCECVVLNSHRHENVNLIKHLFLRIYKATFPSRSYYCRRIVHWSLYVPFASRVHCMIYYCLCSETLETSKMLVS